jgi:glutamate-1-semialdehyde 2,1-aminomutase
VQTRQSTLDEYVRRHPGSRRLYEESLRTFPSGVTHDVRYLQPFPIFVERAAGSRKWDVDGNEYIDYVMGHGALLMGHAHPEITRAVAAQAARGTHYGANHPLELEWGRLVKQLVPSAEAVHFTSSGTEATLMAVRLARAYTGRNKLLKFDHHFHGWHDAVVGVRSPEGETPQAPGVPASVSANTVSVPQGDIGAVQEKLAEGDVAAVILEPTGASWGTLPLPAAFLTELRSLTLRHGVVLIFDEVVTGFRVAPGGAQERFGVTPDLSTFAKILAGGLPGGAVAGRADILSLIEFRDDPAWMAGRRVQHPGTFNANPLSAAAGIEMLRIVATGQPHAHADALNRDLVTGMNSALARLGVPGAVYGLASYFHITLGHEVPRPDDLEWPAGTPPPPRMRPAVQMALKRAMLNQGVDLMSGTGGFVSGVHTADDIAATVEAFESAVRALAEEGAFASA